MLYLLNKDVRTVRWNGEPLHEATSAIVKETMNGDFTLTVKYPISDSCIYQLIQEDMLIKAPTPVLGAQLFRIKKPVEHNDHLEIIAYHISDDVMQRSITPVSVTSQSCGMALSRMVQNTKTALGDFSFNSDIQDRRTFNTTETETLYSVLLDGKHSIVGTWEGELVRDNFAMTVKKSRGENRGVVITTHKNLKDYQRTRNSQNVVTRIHAKSTFKPEGAEKETTIRVTVDSPLINSYPYINEKEYENNNAKSVEELQKWAQAKFTNQGIDKVSDAIKIESYELDGQVVHMGDTVNLKSWKHNVDVFKKAVAYEFDALKEEYISLTFDDKAGTGGSRASGGLSSAADAILGVTESAQEIALEKALQNADLGFDHQAGLLRQEIADGIELARAKAEQVKQELSGTIDQRFSSFNNGPLQEAKRKAEEALKNAVASSLLAQEAKQIGFDAIARLEAFKDQTYITQSTLTGNLDVLKRTVTSEVNQASEYRRTTTEALSRMTGQMNGFATKSEVKQDIDGITQTFAKMKVGGRNLWIKSKTVGAVIEKLPENHVTGQKECYRLENNSTLTFNIEPDFSSRLYQKVTFSAWIKYENVVQGQNSWNAFNCFKHYLFRKNSETGIQNGPDYTTLGIYAGSSDWKYITFTYDYSENQNFDQLKTSLRFNLEGATSGTAWVTGIKVEIGSVATDYSPALEDEEAELLVAKTEFKKTAEGLSTKMSAVEGYVGQDGQRQEALRRYTREESARQATAVRELVTRDFVGKASYQEDVRGIERRFEAITNSKNGSIATQIANYKQSVDGRFADITSMISGKANQADFQRVRETSQLYERILGNTENGIVNNVARMTMTSQLFQVEVGKAFAEHQNLFLNSTLTKGFLGNNGIIYIANVTQKEVTSDFISVEPNTKIIFQHWVTLPENGMAWTAWQFFDKNKKAIDVRVTGLNAYKTTVGKQHNINQITVPANAYFVRFSARMYDDGLIKVEKGLAPSDYSVAPNDALEAVKTVQRQLDGSWSVQNLTSAGSIVSQINATNNQILIEAEKIRLKGKTLLDELTAIQGYFKRLFVGEGTFATLNADIIRTNSITADKLVMDMAMARRFVSSDFFTDTLAAKEAFINKLRSVVVTATLLEGYKGRIGGFQIGTHDKDPSTYWLTGTNSFAVGMSNGSTQWGQTALWVNWGNNWNSPSDTAWFVKNTGQMFCYNRAEFWNTPVVHGDLRVTGDIYYNNKNSGGGSGYWISSPKYSKIEPSGGSLYLYYSGGGYDWILMNKDVSDRRYKHNIEASTVSGLDVVESLKTYSYRKEYDGKIEDIACGIMAQDVQKYAPEAFFENPDGAYSYNTFALVPYLIKAIQELNQKIEKMEKIA
ncbi:phage tail spike protein [Streptococcus sp. HMSC067H01]|uniref:phage tail spike protein n=1 Tax=Streptococcus sp. HMSC067H01 TaxID=1739491 RepID=UPI0009F3A55A|nr:phage tail spike protein [Streptococcus sp. HMSC067H01]